MFSNVFQHFVDTSSTFHVGKDAFDLDLDIAFSPKHHQDPFLDYSPGVESDTGKPGYDPLSSPSSFELLNRYGSRCRRLNGEKMSAPKVTRGMATDTVIQLAAEKFIHSTSYELSVLSHPYPTSIMCHSDNDSDDVCLVQNLLSCAEKVDRRRYEQARQLLFECGRVVSPQGSIVQRLVFYFMEALHEKIDRETGRVEPHRTVLNPVEVIRQADTEMLMAFHNEMPISQITKFSGIQAIMDHIGEAKKVHLIDLELRTGIHVIILLQALASRTIGCSVEYVKITVLGTVGSSLNERINATGKRLESFADSLGMKLMFRLVLVEDVLELNGAQFEIEMDEAIAVYAEYTLMHMIVQPSQLNHLMRVLRGLKNLCVMVVGEAEADCNSPVFVNRFVEALVFYGAYFELMADSFKNDEKIRYIAESTCFNSAIKNMVAMEGDKRKIRHVRIGVWRSFFQRFGFQETELSMSSIYQANLVPKNFASGDSFTFDVDGKSLIIGWKGTPLGSLSAWK